MNAPSKPQPQQAAPKAARSPQSVVAQLHEARQAGFAELGGLKVSEFIWLQSIPARLF